MIARSVLGIAVLGIAACASGWARPVAIDTRADSCSHCRMVISDPRLAAQIVGAGDEPRLFDGIGCLRDYLAASPAAPGAYVYVADHRTGTWIPAAEAVYTRTSSLSTPMGSRLVAHGDAASRDADAIGRGGEPVAVAAILGRAGNRETAR